MVYEKQLFYRQQLYVQNQRLGEKFVKKKKKKRPRARSAYLIHRLFSSSGIWKTKVK